MKKLLLLIALIGTTLSLSAQQYRSVPFLTVPAVIVTNTHAITNLSLNVGSTNWADTTFSNYVGGTLTLLISSTNYDTVQLLQDVALWSDRNGRWYGTYTNAESSIAGTDHPMMLNVTLVGGSGANTAATLTFAPVYNNRVRADGLVGDHATVAGEQWAVSVTPTTTTLTTTGIPVPVYRWPGARALRLLRIVPGDTDANSQLFISDISLNGYKP